MRSVAAVRPCDDIAAGPGRAPRDDRGRQRSCHLNQRRYLDCWQYHPIRRVSMDLVHPGAGTCVGTIGARDELRETDRGQ